MASHISFTAHVIVGSGRGKALGVPTLNLALEDIPEELEEGIYAVWATGHTTKSQIPSPKSQNVLPAVIHYGPRPVFKDSKSCELHLLDAPESQPLKPESLTVEIIEKIRDVRDFDDEEALKQEMQRDIRRAKEILSLPPER